MYCGPRTTSKSHISAVSFQITSVSGKPRTNTDSRSAMGGNASTSLGRADRHSLQDMRCSEADDRPNEETNGKSLFPADKTFPNGAPNVESQHTKDRTLGRSTEDIQTTKFTEDARCGTLQWSAGSRSQPKNTEEDTRDIRSAEAARSTGDTEEDVVWINTQCRTLHDEVVRRIAELGRSLEDATWEYRRIEDRRSEDVGKRRVGVGGGERRYEDGAEVTLVTEEFRYTEDTLRGIELEPKRSEAFRETEKAEDI